VSKDPHGAIWVCEKCAGAAANLAVLRKRLKAGLVSDFWRKVLADSVPSQRPCPSCGESMRGFQVSLDGHPVNLDLCKKCEFVWFDKGELEALPKALPQVDGVTQEARQRMADAIFNVQLKNELDDQSDREVDRVEYWTGTAFLVARLLMRLFLRV
jgi:Zn-finger nucleic acid-binding protein